MIVHEDIRDSHNKIAAYYWLYLWFAVTDDGVTGVL